MSGVRGFTVLVRAGDTSQALAFYSGVLRRGPDYAAHDDFHEWEICPGGWLQVASGHSGVVPAAGRIRFEVADLETEIARLRDSGIAVTDPTTLPDVVAFSDFTDPWGNPLGCYQDLAGPDGPPEVGGSAADDSLFVPGVVQDGIIQDAR